MLTREELDKLFAKHAHRNPAEEPWRTLVAVVESHREVLEAMGKAPVLLDAVERPKFYLEVDESAAPDASLSLEDRALSESRAALNTVIPERLCSRGCGQASHRGSCKGTPVGRKGQP